jgi:DNA processing protein
MHPIQKLNKKQFPPALLEIPQPPATLYIQGNLPDINQHIFLAVVGSRKYSSYGREVCEKLIQGLSGYPIVIVSGLAMGIDSIAHHAALRAGLLTLAIPGSGLDHRVLYPSINRQLANKILEAGGCLLSESEPEERATIWSFPKRNRLMAGLSQAVLIIEATEKSGTLITSRLALDYNRDVLAVPGSIFSPSSIGTNKLIKQGATPILSSEDILEALHFDPPAGERTPNEDAQQKLFADLSAQEKKMVELLKVEPLPRDEIIRQAGFSTSEGNSILMILEIKGLIKETGGEIHLCG